MIQMNLVLLALLTVVAQQETSSRSPFSLVEEYAVSAQKLGEKHPQMQELRHRLADVLESMDGEVEFDLAAAQARLEELCLERKSLIRQWGYGHPKLRENAIKIAQIARILAGDGEKMLQEITKSK